MTQAVAITRMTMRSMMRVRRFLLLAGIELIPALIYLVVARRLTDLRALELAVEFSLGFYIALWFPIVSLMVSSWALGDERRDGTLSFLVLRPISRYTIAASKLAAATAAAVLINSIGAVAMAGGYATTTGSWDLLVPLLVGALITSVAYVAIFLPVGYLTQWSVFIGLGFVLIFENGIASALGGLATLSPWRIGYSALAALLPPEAPIEDLGNVVPGVGGALAKTLVLVILSIVVLGTLFRTRDIT